MTSKIKEKIINCLINKRREYECNTTHLTQDPFSDFFILTPCLFAICILDTFGKWCGEEI
jgi:hypothetical protein